MKLGSITVHMNNYYNYFFFQIVKLFLIYGVKLMKLYTCCVVYTDRSPQSFVKTVFQCQTPFTIEVTRRQVSSDGPFKGTKATEKVGDSLLSVVC